MTGRLSEHRSLSKLLASCSDAELLRLLLGAAPRTGWGLSRTVEVDGSQVFVKTVPVTALEIDRYPSTENLYELPDVYQYGVGSAGFGSGRELAAHLATTRWVLDDSNAHFPLLHHHRLLPLAGQTRHFDDEQLDLYVDDWDGDPSIRRFIDDRQNSQHAIALFIEHVPHVLMDWLPAHQHAIGSVIEQAVEVTDFLRDQHAAHFDANTTNIVTDGELIYFADFGLFLDSEFDLSDGEQTFLDGHRHFDIAELVTSLDRPVPPGTEFEPGADYGAALEPYRKVIDEMTAVFERLRTGPKSAAGYHDEHIAGLLTEART